VIDLCPVGALTSKPARYQARAWELIQRDSIAPHDSVGSNIHLHVRRDEVMRVVPRGNEAVNECWISDRDRFSYEGLSSEDRLHHPMLKEGGKWKEVSWDQALEAAASSLTSAGDNLGTLVSPVSTLEEMYLSQKLTRGLGSNNIDHRLRQTDFRNADADPGQPWLGQSIEALETNKATLLVGSNIRKDQPLLGLRVRKSVMAGGTAMVINPIDYKFNFHVAVNDIVSPSGMLNELAGVASAAGCKGGSLHKLIDSATVEETHKTIAEQLQAAAQQGIILLGNYAASHPDFTLMRALAAMIAEKTGVAHGVIPEAGNASGAWIAGAVPHRLPAGANAQNVGLHVAAMLEQQQSAYLLVNVEPAMDLADPVNAMQRLTTANTVALTPFKSESLLATADILLPIGTFAETSGTFVNAQADLQSFSGAVPPVGEARPAWKVLRVLGNMTNLEGFEYVTSQDVLDELTDGFKSAPDNSLQADTAGEAELQASGLERIADVPIYAADAIVRRSSVLQHTADAWKAGIRISRSTADEAGLSVGDQAVLTCAEGETAQAEIITDDRVTDGAVWYPAAVPGAEKLSRLFGEVTLTKG